MKVTKEAGVLARSERFFSTPSATARNLFFYVTRVGHYYYDEQYNFLDSCDVAHQESHKNFFLTYIRSGCMYFQTTQLFTAERGQVALVDCHKPHRFYTAGPAEALWIHFDGANAASFFEQILAFRGGRQTFSPPPDSRIEQEMAQIISGLRTASMSEVDRSQRIYRILCSLLFPAARTGGVPENDAIAQAVRFIDEHLFEPLSVRRVADEVSLSPSHFSRLFRSTTGFPRTNTSCCTASTRRRRCCSRPAFRSRRSHSASATGARSILSPRSRKRPEAHPRSSAATCFDAAAAKTKKACRVGSDAAGFSSGCYFSALGSVMTSLNELARPASP